MMERITRAWELLKQSFNVLVNDKQLLVFPVFSAIATIVVCISFVGPLMFTGAFSHLDGGRATPIDYLVLFAFYYANYFVVIFFNSALVAAANVCLAGGHPKVSDALGLAAGRIGRIAMWALVAATVGMALRILQDRLGKIGRLVVALLGAAWSLLTYFIVPVIVFEDLDMTESVKRSGRLFKETWGEEVAGGLSLGVIYLLLIVPGFALMFLGFFARPLLLVGILLGIVYFLLFATVVSALKSIFTVALYRYAVWKQVPPQFTPELIQNAWLPKTS